MCDKISPGRRPEELLGNEIAECLLWRKGALLYMYCSTVRQDDDRVNKDLQDYRKVRDITITFILPITTIVPYANSLDLDETPSNSVSRPDPSCLTSCCQAYFLCHLL